MLCLIVFGSSSLLSSKLELTPDMVAADAPIEFIGVKGVKAKGKRVTTFNVDQFNWLSPLKPDPELSVDSLLADQPDVIDDRLGYAEGTQTQLF